MDLNRELTIMSETTKIRNVISFISDVVKDERKVLLVVFMPLIDRLRLDKLKHASNQQKK